MSYLSVGASEFYRRYISRPIASRWRSAANALFRRRRAGDAARGDASTAKRRHLAEWNESHRR